jgi:hypothetical protein
MGRQRAVQDKCAAEGCDRPYVSKSFCDMHYRRWLKSGTVGSAETTRPPKTEMCSVEGCSKRHASKTLCKTHYNRWVQHGTTESMRVALFRGTPEARFEAFVYKSTPTGCWRWLGVEDKDGYGNFCVNGKTVGAHRFAYELANGTKLGRKQVDHKCHHPWCVQPLHLRAVTNKQNQENHQGAQRNSKTGVRGVTKVGDRFNAQFKHNKKIYVVGMFNTIEQAEKAIIAARNAAHTHNDYDRRTA